MFERSLFVLEAVLYLRYVSVLSIAFGGLTCHRWPCMLLNSRCILFSNPTLSARFVKTLRQGRLKIQYAPFLSEVCPTGYRFPNIA